MGVRSIQAARGPLDVVVNAVPSKSVTHRALVAASLAAGTTTVLGPLDAEDTRVSLRGIQALGVNVVCEADRWIVHGAGGRIRGGGHVQLGESGTSMRFLLALAALGTAPSQFDGAERLRQRPLREIAEALIQLGGAVRLGPSSDGLPAVAGGQRPRGGVVRLDGSRSSQFASALLLIAPRLPLGLDLSLAPPVVSLPYVRLTAALLGDFGVRIETLGEHRFRVLPQDFSGREYRVEGDHSSASYFLAAACLLGGRVRVRGLDPGSQQPDAQISVVLERLGCAVERGADWVEVAGTGRVPAFDVDAGDAPDLVPTLAALGLFADGPCTIRRVAHLRHKESDRLEQLATNLRALGRPATAESDRLVIGSPPPRLVPGRVATVSDHRLAMAFAIVGLRLPGLSVDDSACVSKSNPLFWSQFERLEARS